MPPVGLATLLRRPKQINRVDCPIPVWVGSILTPSGESRAYLKPVTPESALAEICAAAISQTLSLSVPDIFLVQDPGHFLDSCCLIGSEDAGAPSLSHLVDSQDPDVAEAFLGWKNLEQAAVFDEWIANEDRNQGNMLYDGRGGWYLIDHSRSMGAWPPGGPVPEPDTRVANCLAQAVAARDKDFGIARMRRFVRSCVSGGKELRTVSQEVEAIEYLGMGKRHMETLQFLCARVPHLPALLGAYGRQIDLNLAS